MASEQFYVLSATSVIVATVASVLLTIYVWSRRHQPIVRYYFWFLIISTSWALLATISFLSPTPQVAAFILGRLKFISVAVLPIAFLAFTLKYAGQSNWLRPRFFALLGIIPFITLIMAWADSPLFITGRAVETFGPYQIEVSQRLHEWFWIHTIYGYGLLLIGLSILIRFALSNRNPHRTQAMITLAGGLVPIAANAFMLFDVITPEPPEFTVVTLTVVNVIWGWALFRYRLYDVLPVARDAVIESMGDAVLVLDLQGRVIDLNPAARALMHPKLTRVIGKHLREIWPDQKTLIESYAGINEAHTEIVIGEGAESLVFDLNISTFYQRKDEEAGRLVVLRNITARKKVEAEREQLIADLEAYGHTVAHDLKNPLGLILGFADMLEFDLQDQLSDEHRHYFKTISRNVEKMANITDELLLLAKVRDMDDVAIQELDMATVVQNAQERLHLLRAETQAEVIVPNTWPVAIGYAPWVEEIWANYLSNAMKYGGTPPCIEVGATLAADKSSVTFWVKDNGKGLSVDEQAQMFTQFTRLQASHAEGHGLGLSIVQRIAEKLSGRATVESTPGQGSVFSFSLPAARQPSASSVSSVVIRSAA